jgi:hypothetical protein
MHATGSSNPADTSTDGPAASCFQHEMKRPVTCCCCVLQASLQQYAKALKDAKKVRSQQLGVEAPCLQRPLLSPD